MSEMNEIHEKLGRIDANVTTLLDLQADHTTRIDNLEASRDKTDGQIRAIKTGGVLATGFAAVGGVIWRIFHNNGGA